MTTGPLIRRNVDPEGKKRVTSISLGPRADRLLNPGRLAQYGYASRAAYIEALILHSEEAELQAVLTDKAQRLQEAEHLLAERDARIRDLERRLERAAVSRSGGREISHLRDALARNPSLKPRFRIAFEQRHDMPPLLRDAVAASHGDDDALREIARLLEEA